MTPAPIPKPRVLVVEDQPDIVELISIHLRYEGFEAVVVEDGAAAQREVDAVLPDIVLLDWMLPGRLSGIDLARKWRADSRTKNMPIIILTARGEEADKIMGLDSGADDYITKPFSPAELMARLRALLRRRAPEQLADTIAIGGLFIDPGIARAYFQGKELRLGASEFRLLHYLMKHPDRIHTRVSLIDKVWGDHVFIEERTIDVHIKRLRSNLLDAKEMIETVRGIGYRFKSKSDA
ncbi:MAG: response regulator [Azoarcus sp.]|jgi:two-component system phosphate regulon response regulator PhoB|nr:response regulator [Azoarcus sp.]